jgi:hypothetical protein
LAGKPLKHSKIINVKLRQFPKRRPLTDQCGRLFADANLLFVKIAAATNLSMDRVATGCATLNYLREIVKGANTEALDRELQIATALIREQLDAVEWCGHNKSGMLIEDLSAFIEESGELSTDDVFFAATALLADEAFTDRPSAVTVLLSFLMALLWIVRVFAEPATVPRAEAAWRSLLSTLDAFSLSMQSAAASV